MIRGLLVDLDGTFADSIPALKAVYKDFCHAYSIPHSEEEFKAFTGKSLYEMVVYLKAREHLADDAQDLYKDYLKRVLDAYSFSVQPMEGAVSTLLKAKENGVQLALVTAATEEMAKRFLDVHQLNSLFNALICIQKDEPGKPHPSLYLRGIKALGEPNDYVVAIEDSQQGVHSALNAGLSVLWLLSSDSENSDPNVTTVKDWKAIQRWME